MKKLIKVISIFLVFDNAITAQTSCIGDINNIYSFSAGGVKYELIKENKTWKGASQCALERGGKLAELDTEQKQKDVLSKLSAAGIKPDLTRAKDGDNAAYVWVGGSDANTEGKWLWDGDYNNVGLNFWNGDASGSLVSGGGYVHWAKSQPNDFQQQQDCLGFAIESWTAGSGGNAGEWNDLNGGDQLYYLIEYSKPSVTIKNYNLEDMTKISMVENNSILQVIAPEGKSFECCVYDILGNLMINYKNEAQVSIEHFAKGVYMGTVNSEGKLTVYKFIIE